jgi:hypothetical protein
MGSLRPGKPGGCTISATLATNFGSILISARICGSNKAWTHNKSKLTLYGEVINLTNKSNCVFESFYGYSSVIGNAWLTLDKMFPILPSAGIVFER